MAWRAIQDTVGVSLSLAELTDQAERIWWRLLAHTDPWGRLDAHPAKVRALCFPMLTHITDEDCGRALLALEQVGRVVVWERSGKAIIQVLDFEERQPREAFRKRPLGSAFPDPPASLAPTEGLIERLYGLNSGPLPEGFRKVSGTTPENGVVPEEIPSFAGVSGTTPDLFRNDSGNLPDEKEKETEKEKRRRVPTPSESARSQAREPHGADLVPHEPDHLPGEALAVAIHETTNAQALVARYVDRLAQQGVPRVERNVGAIAKQIGELLDKDGISPVVVDRAIELLIERQLNPASLASLIPEATTGTKPRSRAKAEHAADALVRDGFGIDPNELSR